MHDDSRSAAWTTDTILALYELPLPELLWRAQSVHRQHHDPQAVQRAVLLSVKTGGCSEDCGYCPQSAHHDTGLQAERMMSVEDVTAAVKVAKTEGASRFCMGAAWRQVKDGPQFDKVLEMVQAVRAEGMEACATLGMLTRNQADRLKASGLTAYNHNLDTSPERYGAIVSTRTFEDRLQTLGHVQAAGIDVCCGGILGMGETRRDRCALLATLVAFDPPPESVPINALVRVPGTPLADLPPLDPLELARMVATARIVLPGARIRLSAGRRELSREAQALCFCAGANSIFFGDKLLTTGNPDIADDERLLADLGLTARVLAT